MTDLHSALKTVEVGKAGADKSGVEFALVRLQWGRTDQYLTLHARPSMYRSSGVQTTDLLSYLGFVRGTCAFMPNECYAVLVADDFDLKDFCYAFSRMYSLLENAARHLSACGIFVPQPEGLGFFWRKPSSSSQADQVTSHGDGHTSPKSEKRSAAEDESFHFVLTWISGGADKGWVTHYKPKHPPLSPEMQSAFAFIHLRSFNNCPECGFEPCHWRFTAFSEQGPFENTDQAHAWFEAHPQNFSAGIRDILLLQESAQEFGFSIWPKRKVKARTIPSTFAETGSTTRHFEYDVALSFAGTERALAEELAHLLKEAGLKIFYDDFYPEQLWGRNLVDLFDSIYGKTSRHCVMFVSHQYKENMWTTHERQVAQARALKDKGGDYILPILVDETEMPGVLRSTGHLSLSKRTIKDIAELLIKKLSNP